MKTLGIQLKGNEAILVVLEKDNQGHVTQLKESAKYKIDNHLDSEQIRQFQNQITVAFDSIKPDRIGIIARNSSGQMASTPISFKLEGIMQLYSKKDIEFVRPQTLSAHFKKHPATLQPFHKYQQDALMLSLYLM